MTKVKDFMLGLLAKIKLGGALAWAWGWIVWLGQKVWASTGAVYLTPSTWPAIGAAALAAWCFGYLNGEAGKAALRDHAATLSASLTKANKDRDMAIVSQRDAEKRLADLQAQRGDSVAVPASDPKPKVRVKAAPKTEAPAVWSPFKN